MLACSIKKSPLLALSATVTLFALASAPRLIAQTPSPAYAALGDSIEFGLGDDIAVDGIGYVTPFATWLAGVLATPVASQNFGVPNAEARDIRLSQLRPALQFLQGHAPVVVSWGGGGNDLAAVATSPQAAACRNSQSCLGRFNGLLNEVEQTIELTIRQLRAAIGPSGRILMRTQYNTLARSGCATPDVVALGNATLEGAAGTVLERGLNDRIRAIAEKYDAQVVDVFLPFLVNANTFIAPDCIHPSGVGYQAIVALSQAAYLAGP